MLRITFGNLLHLLRSSTIWHSHPKLPLMSSDVPYRTALLFLLTSFLFGSSFIAIKIGVAYIPPLLFAALRFLIGGGILLLVLSATSDEWYPRSTRDILGIAAVGVFIISVQNAALNVGIQYIPGATAAILFSLIPLATTGFAELLLPSESPTTSDILGICIGLLGVLIVVRPTPETVFAGEMLGYLLVSVAVIGISLGSVLFQQTQARLGMLPLSAWGMVLGGGATYAASVAAGESVAAIDWTIPSLLSLAYLSTAVATVGYSLYFQLIIRIGSHKANLLSYLDPVMAAIVAWLLTGELISPLTAGGFVVIFLGFVVLEYRLVRAELHKVVGQWIAPHE